MPGKSIYKHTDNVNKLKKITATLSKKDESELKEEEYKKKLTAHSSQEDHLNTILFNLKKFLELEGNIAGENEILVDTINILAEHLPQIVKEIKTLPAQELTHKTDAITNQLNQALEKIDKMDKNHENFRKMNIAVCLISMVLILALCAAPLTVFLAVTVPLVILCAGLTFAFKYRQPTVQTLKDSQYPLNNIKDSLSSPTFFKPENLPRNENEGPKPKLVDMNNNYSTCSN